MGLVAPGIKAVIRLGGTGVPYTTPIGRDIVYTSPWDGSTTEGGVRVDGKTALTYIPFFAGVRLISEDLASLPFGVYQNTANDGRQEAEGHELYSVVHDQANPYMSSFTFRETLQAHALTWGNGYAEIERGPDDRILAMWPLRPDRMELLIHSTLQVPFYRYQLVSGEWVNLPWRNVFHLHGLGFDGLRGYSVVEMARRALGAAIGAEKLGSEYQRRGVIPPAVLEAQRAYNDEELAELRESWDKIDHRNRIAILEEGLSLRVIGIPPKDLQWLESGDHSRSLMATLLRLPPHMLSDVDRSTSWGTGIEQQAIGYVKHTLRPWVTRWETEGKLRLLAEDPAYYLKMTVDALLRGDTAARWSAYTQGRNAGVYNVNDILRMEDRNPISAEEGGDVRLMPLNMVPLDQWALASMAERIELLTALAAAGFDREASAQAVGVPPIEETEPVAPAPAVANGNGRTAT